MKMWLQKEKIMVAAKKTLKKVRTFMIFAYICRH